MTKEMRPSHRIDILSDAIIYYRQKTVNNIGNCATVHIARKALFVITIVSS